MRVVSLDDERDEYLQARIQLAAQALCDRLRSDRLGFRENIRVEFVCQAKNGEGAPLLLDEAGIPDPPQDNVYGPPAARVIEQLSRDPEVIFLIDVKWNGASPDYGFRLAQYLVKQGVDYRRINLLTHYAQDAASTEAQRPDVPWYSCFPKATLDSADGPARLAERLYTAAVNVWFNSRNLPPESDIEWKCGTLIGCSAPMTNLYRLIKRVAKTNVVLLIGGETGSGKEGIAQAVRQKCKSPQSPFITVDCATLTVELADSQLFGHEKGAFTGATTSARGYFRLANNGTIFLDEIGNMPIPVQQKLLRVLQEMTLTPVGGTSEHVKVRVIAATNKNIPTLVEANQFLIDLYYRMSAVTLVAPPLRDRGADVLLLARHLLRLHNEEVNAAIRGFTVAAGRLLLSCSWPGNVRELKNVITGAWAGMADGQYLIEAADLERVLADAHGTVPKRDFSSKHIGEVVRIVLAENEGNIVPTAFELGINVSGLRQAVDVGRYDDSISEWLFPVESGLDLARNDLIIVQGRTDVQSKVDFRSWTAVEGWLKTFSRSGSGRVALRQLLRDAAVDEEGGLCICAVEELISAIRSHAAWFAMRKRATAEHVFWFTLMGFIYSSCTGGQTFIISSGLDGSDRNVKYLKNRQKDFAAKLDPLKPAVIARIDALLKGKGIRPNGGFDNMDAR